MKRILVAENHPQDMIRRVVAPYLIGKAEFFYPTEEELNLYDGQAWEPYLRRHNIDVILFNATHLRSQLGPQQECFHNMQLFLNAYRVSPLVEKMLYLGAGVEFDQRTAMNQIKEEEFGRSVPVTEHALSKYTMNLLARQSENVYNLRMFSIYGEHVVWDRSFLNNACCKAVFDVPITVGVDCEVDYLYMPDLGPVVEWFLCHTPQYHDYNVCSGQVYLRSEIAEIVQRVAGKPGGLSVPRKDPQCNFTGASSRLLAEMGPVPFTNLETGIERVYRYYSEHRDEVDYSVLRQDDV